MPQFTMICDGQTWEGWQSFSVKQSMDHAASGLSLKTTDRFQAGIGRWNVRGGSEVEFQIDRFTIFKGFVTKYDVSISEGSHEISLDAQSKAIDIIECGHEGPYFWKAGTTYSSVIADVLKPYGLEYSIQGELGNVPKGGHRVESSDAAFDIIKNIVEKNKLQIYTDGVGNLFITDGKGGGNSGSLGRGDYTDMSSSIDMSQSFSKIIVKNQQNSREEGAKAGFDKSQRTQRLISSEFERRYRPLVHVISGENKDADELSEIAKTKLTGAIVTGSLAVKTHLDKTGKIWKLANTVYVDEPLCEFRQSMVIHELEFSLDETQGFNTQLGLRTPPGYQIELSATEKRKSIGQLGALNADFELKPQVTLGDFIELIRG